METMVRSLQGAISLAYQRLFGGHRRQTLAPHPFNDVEPTGIDWRGLPTPECFCGGRMFYAVVWFNDEREVGGYVLDGMCVDCGGLVTLPTPINFEVMSDD